MATQAQILANRRNSLLSSGPKTDAGRAAAACNNLRHGLAGEFRVLPSESQAAYEELRAGFLDEHKPATPTETTLVENMAQHEWLRKRALRLESSCFDPSTGEIAGLKQLALCLRYQSTHERGFHKCLNELLKLRAEKRKQEIGFESQTREKERHAMAKERHHWRIRLAEARASRRQPLAADQETVRMEESGSNRELRPR